MKNKYSSGFVTSNVLFVIIAMSVLIFGLHYFVSSSIKHTRVFKEYYQKRIDAEELIDQVVEQLQILKNEKIDCRDSLVLQDICQSFREYDLSIFDCSSGINESFFKKEFLENEKVKNYITYSDKDAVKEYGYINRRWSDGETRAEIEKDFGNSLLVNDFALVNIYMCREDFIDLICNYLDIKDYDLKKSSLFELIYNQNFSKAQAAKILDISEDSYFFNIFDVKTTFWKINYTYKGMRCNAVVAAIPDSNGKIGEYKKVEFFIE